MVAESPAWQVVCVIPRNCKAHGPCDRGCLSSLPVYIFPCHLKAVYNPPAEAVTLPYLSTLLGMQA